MAEYVECEVTALEDDKLLDRFFMIPYNTDNAIIFRVWRDRMSGNECRLPFYDIFPYGITLLKEKKDAIYHKSNQ